MLTRTVHERKISVVVAPEDAQWVVVTVWVAGESNDD